MDPERRNRVAALLATADHIPSAVGRELLAEYDGARRSEEKALALLGDNQRACALALQKAQAYQEDAARLVGWIIKNPVPGAEMTEVLNLHDRT